MDKIQRSAEYYQLLIDKFEKSGRSPNQAQVYKEVKELVLQCSSYEEIQSRMKNEGYYEKPGVALFMDKMASLRDSNKDNGFDDVAAVYQRKYDEVNADGSQMHITGYEQEVMAGLAKRGNIVGHINELFHNYLAYLNRAVYEDPFDYINKVRESAKGIEENGMSLSEALNHSYYKEHVRLDGAEYDKFVRIIEKINLGNLQDDFNTEDADEKFSKAWEVLKSQKKEQGELSKKEDARTKRVVFLALPPKEKGGHYEIVERREEPKS